MATTPAIADPAPSTDGVVPLFDDERAGNIYRTAAEMIRRRGFASTSMADIADAVQLTKPGLYYYVKGKKELLFAIMSYAMDLLDNVVMVPALAETAPEPRLRAIVGAHARLLMRDAHGALGILIDEVEGLADAQKRTIIQRKRRYFELVRQTIADLRRARGLEDLDATTAAFSVLGMVMWLSRWYDAGGRLPSERIAHDITEIALAGVLTNGAATPAVPASGF